MFDTVSDPQLARALVVLSRIAGRSAPVHAAVRDALDERLPALVVRVARSAHLDTVTALTLAVEVIRPAAGAAQAQYDLPLWSAALGQLGLAIGQVAVDGLRAAADHDPEQFQPLLAAALTSTRRPGPPSVGPPTGWPPSRKPSPSTAPSPRPTPPASSPTSPRR